MKFLTVLKNPSHLLSRRHEPEGVRVIALYYWRTLLVTFLLTIFAVIGYGVWGLFDILNGLNVVQTSGPPPAALNRASLDATLRDFEARLDRFKALEAATQRKK